MAVIVRGTQIIGGQERHGVVQYLSTRPVGPAQRARAQQLDDELAAHMAEIIRQVKAGGWLELKGRPGVVRLWWEVGRRLREFVDELDVGPEEDRQFVWRALYDHAGEFTPGKLGTRADRYLNSHFYYCYRLGRYDWATVKAFGDWTSWVEVFDSDRIRADPRIADWLVERATGSDPAWNRYTDQQRMAWFRPLAKSIRARFRNRDTTGLTTAELYSELDGVFEDLAVRR